MPGYKTPYRLDVSDTSGGLMVYVKKGLPSLQLTSFSIPKDIQIIPIEIRLKNMKWLIISIYRPPKQDLRYFLSILVSLMDFFNYERCVIIGDFNAEPSDVRMILSNQKHCLHSTGSLSTGASGFHLLVHTILKSTYTRLNPKKIVLRCLRKFSQRYFETDLKVELDN